MAEIDDKIEAIIISVANRLYQKEERIGLDYEDLRCLDILYSIRKETKDSTSNSPIVSAGVPDNLMELLRAARGTPADGSGQ